MSINWGKQRVLITGGTGFLGYHLSKQLCASGANVKILGLPVPANHPIMSLPVETIWADIRDRSAVRQAAQQCNVVFHMAGSVAMWGPALQSMHDIHVEGTRNVIAVADPSTRIVHTSSIVAVGATKYGAVLNEDSPFNLARVKIDYVQAKRAAEQVALHAASAGHDVVVVNPGYLIGPGDHEPSAMGAFCQRVWRGNMALAAPGGYNLVDVRDVARGHILAAEHGATGHRYILGGENRYMPEFMHESLHAASMKPRAIPRLPTSMLWLAAVVAETRALKTLREPYPSFQHVRLNRLAWFVNSNRAQTDFGYQARPLAQSIKEMYAWYQRDHDVRLRGLTKWWLRAA